MNQDNAEVIAQRSLKKTYALTNLEPPFGSFLFDRRVASRNAYRTTNGSAT